MKDRKSRVVVVRFGHYPRDVLLRRNIPALRDAGLDVDVVCIHDPGKPYVERLEGITVFRLPVKRKRGSALRYVFDYTLFPLLAAGFLIFRSLFRGYDFIEIDTMPDWLAMAALVPKALGAKVILYMFDNIPKLMTSDRGLPTDHIIVKFLVRIELLSASVADVIVAPYEGDRQILIEHGVSSERILVVQNGPDPVDFLSKIPNAEGRVPAYQRGTLDQTGDAEARPFRLVTHGSLLKRYGIETLIEAIDLVGDQIPDLQLDIIGKGEYQPQLEELAQRLHIDDRIVFHDFMPFEQVANWLLDADIGVVPMWADLVPNKLLEYLMLGIPAITSDCRALRLYLDDSCVVYVPPRDARALAQAIVDLYRDPKRRLSIATNGHEAYQERLSWERSRHDYLSIYGVNGRAHGGTEVSAKAGNPPA